MKNFNKVTKGKGAAARTLIIQDRGAVQGVFYAEPKSVRPGDEEGKKFKWVGGFQNTDECFDHIDKVEKADRS